MSSKLFTSLLVAAALLTQPFLISSASAELSAEWVSTFSAKDLATQLRKMNAFERENLLNDYRNYLVRLDSKLEVAQGFMNYSSQEPVEINVGMGGAMLAVGGYLTALPSIAAKESSHKLLRSIGRISLGATATVGVTGLLIVGGAFVSGATRILLNQYQVVAIRQSIKKVHAQITIIEQLTAE